MGPLNCCVFSLGDEPDSGPFWSPERSEMICTKQKKLSTMMVTVRMRGIYCVQSATETCAKASRLGFGPQQVCRETEKQRLVKVRAELMFYSRCTFVANSWSNTPRHRRSERNTKTARASRPAGVCDDAFGVSSGRRSISWAGRCRRWPPAASDAPSC